MTWQETDSKHEFFISELSQLDDNTFTLGLTGKDNLEHLYSVEVCVNSKGELVRLKSVKRS